MATLSAKPINKDKTKEKSKSEMKLGYIQIEKTGKKSFISGINKEIDSIERDFEYKVDQKFFDFLKKKEEYLIPLHKDKLFISKQIRPSILKSLEEAFNHAKSIESVNEDQRLAYLTLRTINIIIKECSTVYAVGSTFKDDQEDLNYVNNFKIFRKVNYNALEMQEMLKTPMPEVYENIKKIRNFPVAEMPELFLSSEELDVMNMIKQSWKTLPVNKNVSIIHTIRKRIDAYEMLNAA